MVHLLLNDLDHINSVCENRNNRKKQEIFDNEIIVNGQVRLPDFMEVANLLIDVIRDKETSFEEGITSFFNKAKFTSEAEFEQAKILIDKKYFQTANYLGNGEGNTLLKFDNFLGCIKRKIEGTGTGSSADDIFDRRESDIRTAKAVFSCGVKNHTAQAVKRINNELDIHKSNFSRQNEEKTTQINHISILNTGNGLVNVPVNSPNAVTQTHASSEGSLPQNEPKTNWAKIGAIATVFCGFVAIFFGFYNEKNNKVEKAPSENNPANAEIDLKEDAKRVYNETEPTGAEKAKDYTERLCSIVSFFERHKEIFNTEYEYYGDSLNYHRSFWRDKQDIIECIAHPSEWRDLESSVKQGRVRLNNLESPAGTTP